MKAWSGERMETFVFNDSTIEHLHRYAIACEFVQNKKVLDIACGAGYGAKLLAEYAASVTGIDIDHDTISQAAKKYIRPNLEFCNGNIEKIPAPDHSFDVVVSFETIEHVSEHEKALREIKRVLKPGGMAIISTPHKKNYSERTGYSNPFHLKELSKEEFIALIGHFFKTCSFLDQKLIHGSVVLANTGERLKMFEGDFEHVVSGYELNPVYVIAFASDSNLPDLASSIFTGKNILEAAVKEKELAVKNSLSYKLGHIILFPLKVVRSLLKRKTV